MRFNRKSILQGVLVSSVVLGVSAIASSARAAEQISLSYQGSEINVTRQELESFTETGVIPDAIQQLLGTDETIPPAIRTLLVEEIKVPAFVEKFLDSSTGEFVLNQLDETISSTSGSTEQDLFDLKTAFNDAASDDQISFIELVRKYPQSNVRVDLTSLEGTYNRVSNFVERVQPALEVAKGFLADIVCDCDTASASTQSSNASDDKVYASSSKPCNTSATAESRPKIDEEQADKLTASQSAQ